MNLAVFLGPTLPLAEAEALLRATYLPPARQGDIYRLARDHTPAVIGIIDGYFHQTAAVWHREILFALSQGIHVFGASSMGALRAAELHVFGMRGVGAIFEAYKNNVFPPFPPPFDRDEEVAIVHGPPDSGFIAVTDALVDMRATFAQAALEEVLGETARDSLFEIAAQIHFQERTYRAVLEKASGLGLDASGVARLEQWLRANKVSQKARDARALLTEIRAFAQGRPALFEPPFHFENALVWERFRAACDSDDAARVSPDEEDMLDELRLDPAAFARVAAAAKLAVAGLAAGTADDSPRHDLHRGAMRLRARHKLARPADLDAWLRDIGADAAGARRLFAREAGLAALDAAPAQALVDHLRAEGSAAALAARARDKRRKLETAEAARLEPSRLDRESLAAWWRETAGGPARAADAEGYARPLGFRDEDALFAALWRERLYRQQLDANQRAG